MHTNTAKQVSDNLRNLISTNHGERLLFPNYGANIKELMTGLGEGPVDEEIMSRISEAVGTFMPYVSLSGFTPVKRMSKTGEVIRLGMIVTFSVQALEIENESLELTMFEAK